MLLFMRFVMLGLVLLNEGELVWINGVADCPGEEEHRQRKAERCPDQALRCEDTPVGRGIGSENPGEDSPEARGLQPSSTPFRRPWQGNAHR